MDFRREGTYGLLALLAALFAFGLISDSAWAQNNTTLLVTKSDDQPDNQVVAGQKISYTITVTNNGEAPAQNVQLTDVLPENTTFVSDNSNECTGLTTGDTSGTLVCNFGTIAAGASETVTLVVQTTAEAGVVGQVSNTATADGSNTAPASDEEQTLVQPRVSITKNDRPNAVEVGEFIVYTLTVTNNTANTQTVTILDELPDEVDFEDVAPDDDCQETAQNSNVVECQIDLAAAGQAGDSATVQIVVQAEENGTAQNTAQAFLGNNLVDQATEETEIDGDNPPPNPPLPPLPPIPNDPNDDFFDDDDNDGIPDGFDDDFFTDEDLDNDGDVDQDDEFLDAQNDLDDDGEFTDGEFTDGDDFGDDDGDGVSATADDDGAEASTPGAFAQSGGDPDDLEPLTSVPDDVEDEIPTSGPLPNTGGMSPHYWLLPLAGLLILAGLPVYRWVKNRG